MEQSWDLRAFAINVAEAIQQTWEPETTANDLAMIYQARIERSQKQPWVEEVIEELRAAAA